MVELVDGATRSDWPIAGARVVNDVRGRRPQMAEFSNRQQNTDDNDVSLWLLYIRTISSEKYYTEGFTSSWLSCGCRERKGW